LDTLVLNDDDIAVEANVGTSVLTRDANVGAEKTRYLAAFLKSLGFRTLIVERRFDGNWNVGPMDPAVLLCGVDNSETRRVIEKPGFRTIVDAGLGGKPSDYLTMSIRLFPGHSKATDVYQVCDDDGQNYERELLASQQYKLLAATEGTCGIERIAGAAVGVPFTGATAATLALSAAIKSHMRATTCGHISCL
jgi:hypothetical protein